MPGGRGRWVTIRRVGGHGCKDTGTGAGTARRRATRRGCGGGAVSGPVRPMRRSPRGRRAALRVASRAGRRSGDACLVEAGMSAMLRGDLPMFGCETSSRPRTAMGSRRSRCTLGSSAGGGPTYDVRRAAAQGLGAATPLIHPRPPQPAYSPMSVSPSDSYTGTERPSFSLASCSARASSGAAEPSLACSPLRNIDDPEHAAIASQRDHDVRASRRSPWIRVWPGTNPA